MGRAGCNWGIFGEGSECGWSPAFGICVVGVVDWLVVWLLDVREKVGGMGNRVQM